MSSVKILHSADIQIKARTEELFKATKLHLNQLESAIKDVKPDVYIISGDLFEYGNTAGISDAERKLMYQHLSSILKIPELKELVIIDGNHDIHPEQKSEAITRDNSLDIFNTIISTLNISESIKLRYFNKSGIYSGYLGLYNYYVVSLRDGEQFVEIPDEIKSKPIISLWHGMLKEYVDSSNLPVRQDIYRKLISINQFPEGSWILSGDIHKRLKFHGAKNQKFIYPGSTQQHTHSEGTYINIGDSITSKLAEQKALSVYEIEYDLSSGKIDFHQLPDYELPNSINYTTITFDHTVPFGVIRNQLDKITLLPEAEYQIIKVKTANTLLSKENEIREILLSKQSAVISFDYEKYVQPSVFNNQTAEAITKIIEEKSEELKSSAGVQIREDDIITSDNIDKLILNNSQIIELFKAVLAPVLKTIKNEFPNDITTEQIESDIISIFTEELDKSLTQSSRYNIAFKSIYTNGFMLLGENTINLDIPGIARILGTNGIGKTTLYNMIRWIIKGELFEGMSKTTKVRNACMCFNNTKLLQNHVVVILDSEINNQKVQIKRTLERKWKTNDLSKINPERWEDSVATIDQQLTVTIHKKDGEPLVIIGEKAQKYLDIWFGKTVDNIMILNHQKLEKILKSPASEINELILEFIGVEYLKKLDTNLELVKMDLLTIAKPKRDAEAIFESRVDCNMYIKNIDSNILEYQHQNDTLTQQITTEKQNQTVVNDKLREIGNVSSKLRDNTIELNKLTDSIKNFKLKELLVLKQLDIPKPEQPDVTEYNNTKSAQQEIYNKIQVAIPKLKEINSGICNSVLNMVSGIISKFTEQKSVLESKLVNLSGEKTKLFAGIQTQIESEIDKLQQIKSDNQNGLNSKINESNALINRNVQILTDIESGVCSKCGRPFAEDFEEHKQILLDEQSSNKVVLEQLNSEIEKIQDSLLNNTKSLKIYEALRSLALTQSDIIFNQDLLKQFTWYSEWVKIHESIISETSNIINNQLSIDDTIQKYQVYQSIKLFTVEHIDNLGESIPEQLHFDISELRTNLDKINKLSRKESQVLITIQETDKLISDIQNKYNQDLQNYNSQLVKLQQYNDSISERNQEIMEYNNQLVFMQSELTVKQSVQGKLEFQLPEYNRLYTEYNQIQENLDELSKQLESNKSQIHVKELNRKEYENQLELLDTEYNDLIKYTKNQIIWKIYSKLIKDNFKEIVFDYYRTYLNNTLNYLLSDVTFKLYWNINSELTFSNIRNGYNSVSKVQLASNMEIAFMGLSLIYTIHVLNVKNNISHIFIDELSGALNRGIGLTYDAKDYQELFVKIINKFKDKTIFIIDHHIQNLFETICYQVTPNPEGSVYTVIE